MLKWSVVAIGWKSNKDCPLCGSAIGADADVSILPTAAFPGLGKPLGDFIPEDDPLQAFCGKKVHRACLMAWPLRARVVGSYLEWMAGRLRDDPERGTAYADSTVLVGAPCDPDDGDAQIIVLDLPTGVTSRIRNADWSTWIRRFPEDSPLRGRFSTPRALVEAIDWKAKNSSCRICMKLLGVNPASPSAFQVPVSEAWTMADPARPMRQYLGTRVHTECYASWPKRALFAATLTDIRYRLAKLSPQGCPWSDARSLVLVERGGDVELTLRATGTTVLIPRCEWIAFEPPASLRPFERDELLSALDTARAKFPSVESLEAAVDWTVKEAERAKAKKVFIDQLRELPIRARRSEENT